MAEVLDHFIVLGFSPKTVIDVGVADGTPSLLTRFPSAKHLLIEPIEEYEKALQDICSQYEAEYVLAAAGSRSGRMEIYVNPDRLDASSLLRPTHEKGKREIPVVTLDDLCRERNLETPYVLKVDVGGAELQVLDGASKTLKDTALVILEVSFFSFGDGWPEFYDVIDYMKKRGFVAYDVFGGHNRPLDRARAMVDIAFVKENGRFRTSCAWISLEQQAEWHSLTRKR